MEEKERKKYTDINYRKRRKNKCQIGSKQQGETKKIKECRKKEKENRRDNRKKEINKQKEGRDD